MKTEEIPELSRSEFYEKSAWGIYYPNRYYFSVEAHKTRGEAGLTNTKHELTATEQQQLQLENYPAILHEFLHYLHDVSTMVGQACLFNQIMMKSIFTKYVTPGLSSAASLGREKDTSFDMEFHSAFMFSGTLEGSGVLVTKMHQIRSVQTTLESVTASDGTKTVKREFQIPLINYLEKNISGDVSASIKFGSFYLFECIANEMDQLVAARHNHPVANSKSRKGTEYSVAKMVAQYYFPLIQIKTVVCCAVMSLQYMDCGNTFISLIQEVKADSDLGLSEKESVKNIKQRVGKLLARLQLNFEAQLNNYISILSGRTSLSKAFGELLTVSKNLYAERITDPCFEIELIYENKINELLNKVKLCDFLYIFENEQHGSDDPELNRDYIGTSLENKDVSGALKTMVAFDHYFAIHHAKTTEIVEKHIQPSYCCPFYTCCDISYRKDNSKMCATTPWRLYELQYNKDQEYCWYGNGVLETKALSIPKIRPVKS